MIIFLPVVDTDLHHGAEVFLRSWQSLS